MEYFPIFVASSFDLGQARVLVGLIEELRALTGCVPKRGLGCVCECRIRYPLGSTFLFRFALHHIIYLSSAEFTVGCWLLRAFVLSLGPRRSSLLFSSRPCRWLYLISVRLDDDAIAERSLLPDVVPYMTRSGFHVNRSDEDDRIHLPLYL
ncbi:hypothetical protein VTN02DRAFT_6429 [Thermoascus thermophilus]